MFEDRLDIDAARKALAHPENKVPVPLEHSTDDHGPSRNRAQISRS
jgi:hypothetical protein